jgi:hypothetical protein
MPADATGRAQFGGMRMAGLQPFDQSKRRHLRIGDDGKAADAGDGAVERGGLENRQWPSLPISSGPKLAPGTILASRRDRQGARAVFSRQSSPNWQRSDIFDWAPTNESPMTVILENQRRELCETVCVASSLAPVVILSVLFSRFRGAI